MTESASCRNPLLVPGSLQLGNWAKQTSDRGGQDKARKVRAVGRGKMQQRIPVIQQTLRGIPRKLRFSAKRYCRSAFDTLRA
jgi:hypothetical protein